MTRNEGNATGNKRRRTGPPNNVRDGGFAAVGGSAAAPMTSDEDHKISVLTSTLGPRLAPMIGILASQPTELNEPLISKSKEMLKLIATIQQRIESSRRFDTQVVDPETNQPLLDTDGNPKPFIPNSCRAKCPVQATGLHNDDPEILGALKNADAEWEACRLKMAGFAKSVAKLEIKNRQKQLTVLVHELATTFALGLVITKQTRTSPTGLTFDRKELATKAIYDAFGDLPTDLANFLAIPAGDTIQGHFAKHMNFVNVDTENKITESDSQFIKCITNELHRSIPAMTIKIWQREEQLGRDRQVNSELRKAFKPKAQAKANRDVEEALELLTPQTRDCISEAARQSARAEANKIFQQQAKSLRKKYSGGVKAPTSKPIDNGRQSRNDSNNTSSPKSNQQQQRGSSSRRNNQRNRQQQQQQNGESRTSNNANNNGGGRRPPSNNGRRGGQQGQQQQQQQQTQQRQRGQQQQQQQQQQGQQQQSQSRSRAGGNQGGSNSGGRQRSAGRR